MSAPFPHRPQPSRGTLAVAVFLELLKKSDPWSEAVVEQAARKAVHAADCLLDCLESHPTPTEGD
jgi:hypothetical protein